MSASAIPAAVIAQAAGAARALLRLAGEGEQAVLETLAATAIGVAEAFTRVPLILRAHEDVLPASASWARLTGTPVMSIAEVTAVPVGAAPFALAVEDYAIDIDAGGHGWVRTCRPLREATRVAVTYQAGLATTWGTLPPAVAHGIAALTAHLFDDRAGVGPPPASVTALLRPWRRVELGMPSGTGR